MGLENKLKEKIAIEVIKTLVTRFDKFPDDDYKNRNAPFHEAFLNAFSDKLNGKVSDVPFFISLSSWLHGLNTTLGQSFFEKIAHNLSNGEKREYTTKKLGNLPITKKQRNYITEIISDLSTSTKEPNLERENQLLFSNDSTEKINSSGFSTDVFIEEDERIIAIELKTVKPNSGEMKGEKQKILEGKAALFNKFKKKKIHFYIGFPFDPTVDPEKESETSFNKSRFLGSIINMNKYFSHEETLVASELWDFLSGQSKTMEQILTIINSISNVNFLDKFRFLNNNENRNNPEYLKILNDWFLFSEKKLIENNYKIKKIIENDRSLTRIYNKTAFDNNGNYSIDRYNELERYL